MQCSKLTVSWFFNNLHIINFSWPTIYNTYINEGAMGKFLQLIMFS